MSEQRQPDNVPTFGLKHRLALAMEQAELSVEDMADEIGRGPTTIRNYLSGRTVPTRGIVTAWAVRCRVDRDWLLTGVASSPGDDPDGTRDQGIALDTCTVHEIRHLFPVQPLPEPEYAEAV